MTKHFVFLLLLVFGLNVKAADLESSETQTTGRGIQSTKNLNAIPLTTQKSQDSQYYTQQQQPVQQYYPVQYVQQPIQYPQTQHQPTMILVAQPAQIQQQLLTTAAQQLLQYFHGNPQARVQFLQGNFIPNIAQVQPQTQQYVQPQLPYYHLANIQQPSYQQPLQHAAIPIQTHQLPQVQSQPSASYNIPQTAAAGAQDYNSYQNAGQFGGHSTSLNHIAALAQLAAQKYVPSLNYRTPAPIITGLENFTPEQQAQIKAQINSGQPITPLKSSTPLNTAALQQLYSAQTAGKDSVNQDQYQSNNSNDDSKGNIQASTSQNYQNNPSSTNSNNYSSFGTKG